VTTLSVGGLLDAVAAQLNAVDFTGDQASEDHKFLCTIGKPDRFTGDRMVAILPNGSKRTERVLDRRVYEIELEVIALYRLTADNWTTAANDAARIAEVMHEIVSAVDAVQDVTVDFADIDVTGDGFLASSRFVRVEWNRTA
tara:strand:+ start:517 stop:942 length:426 start_codon:yes stop_codon:yes gene_type:complete